MYYIRSKLHAIFEKYANSGIEFRATFWYTICNVTLKVISLITIPLFTRLLTDSEYGQVSIFYGWKSIIIILCTVNLPYAAYNTAMVKYKDKIDEFTSTMLGLIGMLVVMWCGIGFLFKNQVLSFLDMNPFMLVIILLDVITLPAYDFWMARCRFSFEYRKIVYATGTVAIIGPILSIILICFTPYDNAVMRLIGSELPAIVIGGYLLFFLLAKGKKLFKYEFWKFGLQFTVPLIPHYLSGTILNQADRIMIEKLISDSKAGIYSVAYGAAFTMSVITSAINNSLVPWTYRKMEEKGYKDIYVRTRQLLLGVAAILLVFIMLIPEVITILAPSQYREAIYILPVLVMSVFFQFLYGFFGTIEFYFEKSVFAMLASVISASSNLILNMIAIPIWGYFAAGYTTLVSFVIMSICHYIFMKVVLKKKKIVINIFDTKSIILISLALIGIGLLESLLYEFIIVRYIIVFASVFIGYKKRKDIVKIFKMIN